MLTKWRHCRSVLISAHPYPKWMTSEDRYRVWIKCSSLERFQTEPPELTTSRHYSWALLSPATLCRPPIYIPTEHRLQIHSNTIHNATLQGKALRHTLWSHMCFAFRALFIMLCAYMVVKIYQDTQFSKCYWCT